MPRRCPADHAGAGAFDSGHLPGSSVQAELLVDNRGVLHSCFGLARSTRTTPFWGDTPLGGHTARGDTPPGRYPRRSALPGSDGPSARASRSASDSTVPLAVLTLIASRFDISAGAWSPSLRAGASGPADEASRPVARRDPAVSRPLARRTGWDEKPESRTRARCPGQALASS